VGSNPDFTRWKNMDLLMAENKTKLIKKESQMGQVTPKNIKWGPANYKTSLFF